MPAPLMTPDEVAAELRVTRAQVQEMARTKEIKAFKIGRYWRFERKAIDEYLSKARVSA